MNYLDLSIKDIHEALLKKEVTPLELTLEAISRAEKDECNSFEYICKDEAIEFAKTLNDIEEDNLLYGIPYCIKDNFSTKDIKTTGSSNILNNYVPIFDATVVKRLKENKCVLIGKTTLDELAMGGSGTTGHRGTTQNPFSLDHSRLCGGSSCGSASVVASSIVPFAIGSDTGDSIRKPASYCGLVGLKPTWGRISRFGLFPFATSMDHVGLFTRNVEDSKIVLQAIEGRDELDYTSSFESNKNYIEKDGKGLAGKKLVVIKEIFESCEDEYIKDQFKKLLEKLKKCGVIITFVNFNINLLRACFPTYYIISCAEATSNNANLDGVRFGNRKEGDTYLDVMKNTRTEGFGKQVKHRFILGSYSLLSENQEEVFLRAQKARSVIVSRYNSILDSCDAILGLAAPTIAPKFDKEHDKMSDYYLIGENHLCLANFAGVPSITIPMGIKDEMPFGLNITNSKFKELELLDVASNIEKITGLAGLSAKNVLKGE